MSKDEERYDVSQHDGITEGKWTSDVVSGQIIVDAYNEEEGGDIALVRQVNATLTTMEAICALPDILDALKKAYEELDTLKWLNKEIAEANTVKGEILDMLRTCDECGKPWDDHLGGADCEADRQNASE